MPRYFATTRIAWGARHLAAGEELTDPDPNEERQKILLEKIHLPAGTVRVGEPPATVRTPAVAPAPEQPKPAAEPPAETQRTRTRARREQPAAGAMTTRDAPSLTERPRTEGDEQT